jgi:hypothetical protein
MGSRVYPVWKMSALACVWKGDLSDPTSAMNVVECLDENVKIATKRNTKWVGVELFERRTPQPFESTGTPRSNQILDSAMDQRHVPLIKKKRPS